MPDAWPRNRLTELLGLDYPIIQGPLGGLSSERLTAEVSNFGGLGSFGAHSYAPGAIGEVVARIRGLTSRPFAMNLWVSMEDEGARGSGEEEFQRALAPLLPLLSALGAPVPAYRPYVPASFDAQVRVLLEAKVPVISFIFGVPPGDVLAECRARGIVTIGTATTPEEAVALERAGVDAVAASGFEGGGHRGSFLRAAEDSLMGTFALVPQVVDAVRIPVIAAGGIADARGVVAALALGAEGVQLGTAFLSSDSSGASRIHREALRSRAAGHTALTRGFTGRLARGISNPLLALFNRGDVPALPYPLQRALVKHLAVAAESAGRADLLQLWAGQAAPLGGNPDGLAFLTALVAEVAPIAGAVSGWSRARSRGQREWKSVKT